jgi:hypothetical protein
VAVTSLVSSTRIPSSNTQIYLQVDPTAHDKITKREPVDAREDAFPEKILNRFRESTFVRRFFRSLEEYVLCSAWYFLANLGCTEALGNHSFMGAVTSYSDLDSLTIWWAWYSWSPLFSEATPLTVPTYRRRLARDSKVQRPASLFNGTNISPHSNEESAGKARPAESFQRRHRLHVSSGLLGCCHVRDPLCWFPCWCLSEMDAGLREILIPKILD